MWSAKKGLLVFLSSSGVDVLSAFCLSISPTTLQDLAIASLLCPIQCGVLGSRSGIEGSLVPQVFCTFGRIAAYDALDGGGCCIGNRRLVFIASASLGIARRGGWCDGDVLGLEGALGLVCVLAQERVEDVDARRDADEGYSDERNDSL